MKRYFPDHDHGCREAVEDETPRRVRGARSNLDVFEPCMASIAEVVRWQVDTRKTGFAGTAEIVLSVALRDGTDAAEATRKIAGKLLDETGVAPDVIDVLR